MLTIRAPNLDEVPALSDLATEIFKHTFLPTNKPENVIAYVQGHLNCEQFLKELHHPEIWTYLVFKNNEPLGYLQLVLNSLEQYEGASLELRRFYLQPKAHGKGIAQEMMSFCFEKGRELCQDKLWLGVWENNHIALRFYQKMGFRRCSSHDFQMGDEVQTDLILIRSLSEVGNS